MVPHTAEAPLLAFEDVEVFYDQNILALRGVSLTVAGGALVVLLGPNGAGKTTTLKAASSLLGAERAAITRGRVRFGELDVKETSARSLVLAGLVQVLEGRHCFPHLSVEENLLAGGLARGLPKVELRRELERVYAYFPRLRERRDSAAGFTSGGEQQMLAIGRALITRPKLVLLDEPSMGLAPLVVDEIFRIVRTLNREEGVTFLLAEQNARIALQYADFGYLLDNGEVVRSGPAAELRERTDVREFYLGMGAQGRKRFVRPPRVEPPCTA